MAFRFKWKSLLCCCCYVVRATKKVKKTTSNSNVHKYCGCGAGLSSKQGGRVNVTNVSNVMKMTTARTRTCEDDRTLVEEDAVDVLDYDFIPETKWCIEEPELPFSYEFSDALQPQFDIIIEGTVDLRAFRFAVNLVAPSQDATTDIVFHFNPRFDQRYSACNSFFQGKWGEEEHFTDQKFPFERGHKFFLEIFLTHSCFLVAVNGVQYTSFAYRTSILNITGLVVEGDVTLSRVNLYYTSFYPSTLPLHYPPSPYKFALPEGITKYEPQVTPIYGYLQGKLRSGSEIEINGQVQLLPLAFYINLQQGSHIWPHPEIPLHMSVRFGGGFDRIRTNSWIDTSWGKEERVKKCVFTPGYDFCLRIKCTEEEFVVHVDDVYQLAFKHRVPYTNIDTLHIQGDVIIYDIRVCL